MKFLELFFGLQGTVISSLILLPIFLLMLLISINLFKRRRKKSYLTLSIALVLTLIDHGISISHSFMTSESSYLIWIERSITALGDCAFFLLILGLYQLYHTNVAHIQWIFYTLCAAAFGIVFLNDWVQIGFVMAFLLTIWFIFGRHIGSDHKFRWAIFTFFVIEGLQVWSEYKQHENSLWVSFLVKVLPVLSYSILFFILLERVIEVMQKSYMQSITDALTGLFNRRHLYENVEKSVKAGQSVSIIFIDIDNFKKLNDTKGHKAGDEVLKQVASIFREEVDGIGIAARYGGEEMVALIRDKKIEMKQLTERIRFRIEKETNPGVTASIGYSYREDGISHDELITQADKAMYQAKTTGKNKVVRYIATPVIT
ncbi:sensor domain-containing diguanylate cyclase [Paenibacillus periandrae]|uniref:GGDEF domain-containing protein n=1 Tax=Paenibacillus periandrae TaxID=1761741 RepID=UPI001F096517|nr:GGDEF domain-containing protein [Paenibacillus periandrae]